jgi:hypothetical protein
MSKTLMRKHWSSAGDAWLCGQLGLIDPESKSDQLRGTCLIQARCSFKSFALS